MSGQAPGSAPDLSPGRQVARISRILLALSPLDVSLLFVFTAFTTSGHRTRIEALLDEIKTVAAARRELDIRAGRALHELVAIQGLPFVGCASVGQLGELFAIAGPEALMLFGLGKALKSQPYVEDLVRRGRVSVAAAACVGEVLDLPALQRADDDWIGWAMSETLPSLRKRVQLRREEARLGDVPPVPVSFFVRRQARDDFDRARTIASRKAFRALTPGETFETVTDHYLDTFDEERVTPGTRRLPDTAFVDGRYVPAAVRREIRERQGDKCAVPFCYYARFLEMAHRVAHASGGCREADNLVLLCYVHHGMFDRGELRMEGTASAPRFFDAQGRELGVRIASGALSGANGARDGSGPRPETPSERLCRELREAHKRASAAPSDAYAVPIGSARGHAFAGAGDGDSGGAPGDWRGHCPPSAMPPNAVPP